MWNHKHSVGLHVRHIAWPTLKILDAAISKPFFVDNVLWAGMPSSIYWNGFLEPTQRNFEKPFCFIIRKWQAVFELLSFLNDWSDLNELGGKWKIFQSSLSSLHNLLNYHLGKCVYWCKQVYEDFWHRWYSNFFLS